MAFPTLMSKAIILLSVTVSVIYEIVRILIGYHGGQAVSDFDRLIQDPAET